MSLFFSKSTTGFYDSEISGANIPEDAVEITQEKHAELLQGQSEGKIISADKKGNPVLKNPPPPSAEQVVAGLQGAVQTQLDTTAQAAGYDDIRSAVTYADEPAVPKFQREGQAFRAWRSLSWAKCSEVLNEVKAGKRPMPSVDELLAELPVFELPKA